MAEHPPIETKHLKPRTEDPMLPRKWTIGLRTAPADAGTAEREARWLKLGDNALSNEACQEPAEATIAPGVRALRTLERATLELRHALEKYRAKERHRIL